jgi:2-amino-4-hydroxy-6-hydroxymethyldihydropteridine diphosphokinase
LSPIIAMSHVFIGVGSNQGDRLEAISKAARALGAARGVRLLQMATVIETEPVGGPPQGSYLNTVLEAETSLRPRELLAALQAIERALGRIPSAERWAPRPIDLDLLLYDDVVMAEPDLAIPHPRLHERLFVLEPLSQLAPGLLHPVLRRSVAALRDALAAAPS